MRLTRLGTLLAAAGLAATTVPLLSATQASATGADTYLPKSPVWQRCSPDQPASFECATVKVPLDYRRPQGRKIDIALSRIKSQDPAKRRGIMLLNPGGPGGSGVGLAPMVHESMPKEVRDQYDLIGFDPRGVGGSSPISCRLTDAEQNFDRPYRPETFASDVAWARTVAEKCRKQSGSVLPHITTRNAARDMDAIRAALGEKKISYLGYSYGTYLGAVYTQMFPKRTDRFVLDSGVDPARIWRGMIQVWATDAEPAFARWSRWTAERNAQYHLGATPQAVSRTFWDLVARADREPIEIDGMKLTGDDIRSFRAVFFYPQQAAETVVALKAAAEGKPAPTQLPDLVRTPAPVPAPGAASGPAPVPASGPAPDNGTAVFWAVVCGDTANWPRDPERYRKDAERDKARYPLYGDFASNIKPCAFWQPPVEAATPMNVAAPVLTVQNEWDSQTPLSSGLGLRRALKGSRMVTAAGGEGHGVYLFDPKSCANATVNHYLATGKLPAKDVTCRTTAPDTADRREAPVSPERQRFPLGGTNRF
ncbi:alpha/beta hydrolase [Streptomyces sp. NPDC012888]|uniref:alpha/beta hydrolase n=1 Tax=Streptomyces sp. NPDC012888 TaxID=3364855 RepID=UPI0036ACA1A5